MQTLATTLRGILGSALLPMALACGPSPPAPSEAVSESPSPSGNPSAEGERRKPDFIDATAASGLDFEHFNGMTGKLYFCEMVGPGGALADLDGDGDLDVFAVQGGPLAADDGPESWLLPPRHPQPLTHRLYRNELAPSEDGNAELRLVDVTDDRNNRLPPPRGYGMGVASGDIDNDGDVDLYVTAFGSNQLLRNRGDGSFEDVTEATGADDTRWSISASFTDLDRDGWLDLFIVNYVKYSIGTHKNCRAATGALDYCGPHSYPPQTDRLLRNRGDGTFEDVTGRWGIEAAAGGGLGVVTSDFDGDGWLDLYVANDGSANHFWTGLTQSSPGLSDQALLRGAALNRDGHAEAGMGVDAGDFDNDGDEDIFLSHLTQETNTLYANLGDGIFDDTTSVIGLGAPSWEGTGFGTGFLDIDNDGWLDVLVVNGAVKVIDSQRSRGDVHPLHQPNQLYRNRGDGTFEELDGGPAFEASNVSRGAAFGDIDNDGDLDVLVLNNGGPARLLLNRRRGEVPWLGLRLTSQGGWDLLGTRVTLERDGGETLHRTSRTGGSYASARDPRLLFGLGAGAPPAEVTLTVTWPGGDRERFVIRDLNKYHTLSPGQGQPGS